MNEETKVKLYSIIGIIVLLILLYVATINFEKFYGVKVFWHSIQYDVILLGTGIIIAFLVARILDKPEIGKMKLGTAKIYFSTTIHVMLASFAAFGIAFSILWGNLYTYALEEGEMGNYINNLRGQGLVLLLLVFFASITMLFTFLLPLIRQINEKEGEQQSIL